ncbi:ribbon-helix-helix domain-containing protein [Methanolobus sp. ZRKC3]|uniref:ribbon-helix-helix domain-containing protein n=1 Tax=Methanolobus sp. ZRKC3 TaxID=3125786 RepID=UPI00324EFDB6
MQTKQNEIEGVSVKMPSNMISKIEKLIEKGEFENRSHAIRTFTKNALESNEYGHSSIKEVSCHV